MKPNPCIFDAKGRVLGTIAQLPDGRFKARPLRGFPVARPRYFPDRALAAEWIRSVAGGECLSLEVAQ